MSTLGGSLISNRWTLKKLVQNTYKYKKSRFDYKIRDLVKVIRIERRNSYQIREDKWRTSYRITTQSFPNYYPYYTRKDSRGRSRQSQRTFSHVYETIIQLDSLSINVPVKLRLGSDKKWRFNSKTRKLPGGRIIESENTRNGINGDFFFRCEYIYKKEGILFGRNLTNGPPTKINPQGIVFLPKHLLSVIETLMNQGVLKDD